MDARTREHDVVAHSYRRGKQADNGSATLSVLLAIEHPVEAIGARVALERGGFQVCAEANSAHEAIETADRERPDVCLIDLHLAGDGLRAVEEIRRRRPGTAIAIYPESERAPDFLAALQAGATGYLLMNAHSERLPHALRAVVNGEAALPRHLVPRLINEYRKLGRNGSFLTSRGVELTNREVEVFDLMTESLTTQEIADRLSIAPVTVRTHVSAILKKLRVSSRGEALKLLHR